MLSIVIQTFQTCLILNAQTVVVSIQLCFLAVWFLMVCTYPVNNHWQCHLLLMGLLGTIPSFLTWNLHILWSVSESKKLGTWGTHQVSVLRGIFCLLGLSMPNGLWLSINDLFGGLWNEKLSPVQSGMTSKYLWL